MAAMRDLARIERVEDLRGVWPNEAGNFTPWLAEKENISVLGDALGIRLEVEAQEAPVGGYSLDILARDTNGRRVVIENQLEDTDHTHLGQLLTYAGNYDGNVAVVWIAKEFNVEHIRSLHWLNSRTGEDTEFYGVVVELLKIGDSPPAPHFDVLIAPAPWHKARVSKERAAGSRKGNTERYRIFFQKLTDKIREEHGFTQNRIADGRSWCPLLEQTVCYTASFQSKGKAWAEIFIDQGNEGLFGWLMDQKSAIETEFGEPLVWKEKHARGSAIAAERPGSIHDDADTLEDIQEWMIDRLLRVKQVLGPRLEEWRSNHKEARDGADD